MFLGLVFRPGVGQCGGRRRNVAGGLRAQAGCACLGDGDDEALVVPLELVEVRVERLLRERRVEKGGGEGSARPRSVREGCRRGGALGR